MIYKVPIVTSEVYDVYVEADSPEEAKDLAMQAPLEPTFADLDEMSFLKSRGQDDPVGCSVDDVPGYITVYKGD